jgi:hypothetical protein
MVGDVSYVVLRPGHSVLLNTGEYAQVLIPRVSKSKEGDGSLTLLSIFTYVLPNVDGGNFPELPVPWLRRGEIRLVSLRRVFRRVHVVPLFGDAQRPRGDSSSHFLVNTTGDMRYGGPANRVVYLRCANATCQGLIPKPRESAFDVSAICPTCNLKQAWL